MILKFTLNNPKFYKIYKECCSQVKTPQDSEERNLSFFISISITEEKYVVA
jgi:hypothetical protein